MTLQEQRLVMNNEKEFRVIEVKGGSHENL